MSEQLDDIYTCIGCGLTHRRVECKGIYYCPNVMCTASGNYNFRSTIPSTVETKRGHEVDLGDWVEAGYRYLSEHKDIDPEIEAAIRGSMRKRIVELAQQYGATVQGITAAT